MADNTVSVSQGPAAELVLAEAVVVDPEVAWTGLQELHRRALGETGDFRLPGIAEMSPIQAFDAYERADAVALAQIGVFPAEFADGVVTSIDAFAREHGSLDGLEGLLLSASLAAAGLDLPGGEAALDAQGTGAGARAYDLLRDLGVPEVLGGGRGVSHILDAGTGQLADVARDRLEGFVSSATHDATHELRSLVGSAASEAADAAGAAGGSGGAFALFRGLVELAAGAVCTLVYPPAAPLLLADGAAHTISGLSTLAHGEGAHGAPPAHGAAPSAPSAPAPGTSTSAPPTPAHPGTHAPDRGHSAPPFTTTYEVHTRTIRYPDGTTVEERRETYTTTGIATEVRPKDHGGSADRLWDDTGGGFDDESGRPRPINPLATLLCPPHPDGPDEPNSPLALPKVGPDGRLESFGAYDLLDAVLEASPVDGVIDVSAELAAAVDTGRVAVIVPQLTLRFGERGARTPGGGREQVARPGGSTSDLILRVDQHAAVVVSTADDQQAAVRAEMRYLDSLS